MAIDISERAGGEPPLESRQLFDIAADGTLAHPVSFKGLAGIFHPPRYYVPRAHAVLLISPFGMVSLFNRKFHRIVFERPLTSRHPTLRVGYLR